MWEALAEVIQTREFGAGDLPPEEASVEKRSIWPTGSCRWPCAPRISRRWTARAQFYVAMGYFAACQPERVPVEAEKAAALNPYDAGCWASLGFGLRSLVTGTKGPRSPKRLSSWRGPPRFHLVVADGETSLVPRRLSGGL